MGRSDGRGAVCELSCTVTCGVCGTNGGRVVSDLRKARRLKVVWNIAMLTTLSENSSLPNYGVVPSAVRPKDVTVTVIRYSLRLRCDAWFRLTYRITEGPRPNLERYFLTRLEELGVVEKAA